jgi:hypothetical protein
VASGVVVATVAVEADFLDVVVAGLVVYSGVTNVSI